MQSTAAVKTSGVKSRSTPLAWLFIVITLLGPSNSWHAYDDDPDCAGPVAHDHSQHHARFRVPATSSAPEHCAFCHWLRAFGAGQAEQSARQPLVATSTAVHTSPLDLPRTVARRQRASRAPPAFLPVFAG